MKKTAVASAISFAMLNIMAFNVSADEQEDAVADENEIETVTIYGSVEEAQNATGSVQFLGAEELEKFAYTDIQRIARQIPGVSIQIEDGFGLRPNIGIRGVATDRSARITILEDNVLVSPAPYSAPAAYYFPTIGRINAIEVVKGPAAITQGPYTIGGAINLVSTPIPDSLYPSGKFVVEAGQDNTNRIHATVGGKKENGFGYLLEFHDWNSDGFQTIDRSDTDTGLDVRDYTLKLAYAPEDSKHSVDLKVQYNDQDSNQSYLGLTDDDFRADANRRYGLSELDNIGTQHQQFILKYGYEINDQLNFTATAYNNNFERDWFKTEGIDLTGSPNAENFRIIAWFDFIQAVNRGEGLEGFTNEQLRGILDGTENTAFGAIQVRSNARDYYSRGVQFRLDWQAQWGETDHDIEIGLRVHRDHESRLQRNSTYQQIDGQLELSDLGLLGNAGNFQQDADAIALHIYDTITWGDWIITPGLRIEDIDQSRTDFADGALRTFVSERENDVSVVLPGLGILYNLNEKLEIFGGIHKGFTAPTNTPGVDEESAINYELGTRYTAEWINLEATAFLSDYQNLLGICTASSGANCDVGDAFNGDAATVQGLEFAVGIDLGNIGNFAIPLRFTYTYTDSQFDTDITGTDFFGNVSAGDPIPYIADNQGQISLGFESTKWAAYVNGSFIDEVCVRASCEAFEVTDSSFTVDISASYYATNALTIFARIENLTDQEDILGRQPYGARPNKDRTATLGARYNF